MIAVGTIPIPLPKGLGGHGVKLSNSESNSVSDTIPIGIASLRYDEAMMKTMK
jgi:hypothetical protein